MNFKLNNGTRGFSPKKPISTFHSNDPKILLKDGVWQVPIKERPNGWERLGGKEKDNV